MKRPLALVGTLAVTAGLLAGTVVTPYTGASSHREAPLIGNDPAADTTDMYVFRSPDAPDTVTAIMNVWPFQLPEAGPYWYLFDPNVRYSMHITNDGDAEEEIRLDFRFRTESRDAGVPQLHNGPITSINDENFLYRQFYSVDLVAGGQTTRLGDNIPVAPPNIGPKSIPDYDAVANQAIGQFQVGGASGKVFAGPRDDPFFIDVGAAFDLLNLHAPLPGNNGGGIDQLAGHNILSIAVQVPIAAVGRPECDINDPTDMDCVVGMWLTTSRPAQRVLRGEEAPTASGDFVQVSRLSAALVNELVVPTRLKDAFNASNPNNDERFLGLVQDPIPAKLLNTILGIPVPPTPRQDLVTIFLTGIPGLNQPPNVEPAEIAHLNVAIPVTANPSPLGVLGGDNQGYPNGRRLFDDVTDISLRASAGGTPFTPEFNVAPNNQLGDGVPANDKPFLNTFPYLAAPHVGRDHTHHNQFPVGAGAAAPAQPAAAPARSAAPAGAPAQTPRFQVRGTVIAQEGETITLLTSDISGNEQPIRIDVSGLDDFSVATNSSLAVTVEDRSGTAYRAVGDVSQGSEVNRTDNFTQERETTRDDSIDARSGNVADDDEARSQGLSPREEEKEDDDDHKNR